MKPKFCQIENAFQLIVWQFPLKHNHSHTSPMQMYGKNPKYP
ncbi:hypothetical protein [Okeania sp. SIO1I7]|nr:hypothetical protein [Okeania sp. SIO1I7]